jgi:molybdenum cofactor cytidylyltransferase
MAVCGYEDGRGHPLAFSRAMFGALGALNGDKAVWRLMDELGDAVAEVPVGGRIPADVDTWDDYEALLASGVRS